MTRMLLSLAFLILIYALTLDSFKPWDLLIGAVISGTLLLFMRRYLFGEQIKPLPGLVGRVIAFFPFALAVLIDVTAGIWSVALIVLHLRPMKRPGIVTVPIGERTRTGAAVTGLVTTLSPGSVLVDIDWDQGVMLFHVLDATDPEAVRRTHRDFYDRYQQAVFP